MWFKFEYGRNCVYLICAENKAKASVMMKDKYGITDEPIESAYSVTHWYKEYDVTAKTFNEGSGRDYSYSGNKCVHQLIDPGQPLISLKPKCKVCRVCDVV